MERREFLEAMALVPAAQRRARRAAAAPPDTRWRFSVDDRGRWSLARGGTTAVRNAEIALELGGPERFTLGELEGTRRIRTGSRRTGDTTLTLIGRRSGLEVSAQFEDDERPVLTVRVRGLGEPRDLQAVHFTGGVQVTQGQAWINGYQSWSSSRVQDLGPGADVTGFWQLALLGGGRGNNDLAMVFGEADGASGRFHLTGRSLDAIARFDHRAVSEAHAPAICSLSILPGGDAFTALGADAASRVGPLRYPTPSGWCSWYELYDRVTEDDVLASLEVAQHTFDPRYFRVIQVDDGFQRAAGDWDTNAKFPHGHRWLTDRIHAAGFQAGLWMAPFGVTPASGIPAIHPDWLVQGETGAPLVLDERPAWGGTVYGLDASQRVVQDWLRGLTRHAVDEWGYDYLKLDFLYYGALGRGAGRGASGHEALRSGLRALREGAGRAFVLGCGAPLQHSLGTVDGMRIGEDVDASWGGIQPGVRAALQRAHLHGRAWRNDPDALVVREPLTLDEARAWASVVALSGQMAVASDRLDRLPAERLELLQRAMPAAGVRGRALDLAARETATAPALLAGETTVLRLPATWSFSPGDDLAWADPSFDDAAWRSIAIGAPWEQAGFPDLDGFAWYRVRFTAPRKPSGTPVTLALGKIDDADETFLNGVRIGATGALPPAYRAEWQTFRRYVVPDEAIRWGAANVLAVRVYDGGGGGGLWRLTRDAPPSRIVCRQREDWFMVGLFNWDDTPKKVGADLATAGITGGFAAYDVWAARRVADVSGRVELTVPARSGTILGLRRSRRSPFVLGTTRHIVQGEVDINEEQWDARRRRLSGTSGQLDGRPYEMTLALPAGFRPKACRARVACSIGAVTAREAKILFEGTRDDLAWEVTF